MANSSNKTPFPYINFKATGHAVFYYYPSTMIIGGGGGKQGYCRFSFSPLNFVTDYRTINFSLFWYYFFVGHPVDVEVEFRRNFKSWVL